MYVYKHQKLNPYIKMDKKKISNLVTLQNMNSINIKVLFR